ncbi:VOC family protein [Streptacidiphilus sp. PAMC 29251]
MSYWNDLQIELIQPIGGAESLWSRAVETDAGKLNHCAVMVSDIDATVQKRGLEKFLVHRGAGPGLHFAYLESYLPDGSHLELLQVEPGVLQGQQIMQEICRTWDGTRPVRTLEELVADFSGLPPHSPA